MCYILSFPDDENFEKVGTIIVDKILEIKNKVIFENDLKYYRKYHLFKILGKYERDGFDNNEGYTRDYEKLLGKADNFVVPMDNKLLDTSKMYDDICETQIKGGFKGWVFTEISNADYGKEGLDYKLDCCDFVNSVDNIINSLSECVSKLRSLDQVVVATTLPFNYLSVLKDEVVFISVDLNLPKKLVDYPVSFMLVPDSDKQKAASSLEEYSIDYSFIDYE